MAEDFPKWNIKVTNSSGKTVVEAAKPADLNAMRKEFDNFEFTVEGFVPIRFLGLDDNKVNKKRAVRVMDGRKAYEIGFDTDTTLNVTLTANGDELVFYSIQGGTADNKQIQLIGGDLGPKEFITDEQRVNYYNMQVFVQSMYYLRPSKYSDIQAWYNDLKGDAKEWDLKLYPKILSVATDIVDYCRKSQSSADGFIEAMKEISTATGQERQDIIDGVKQILSDLKKTATENYNNSDSIYKDLGVYSSTLTTHNADGSRLYKTYDEKIGATSQEVTDLKERIRVLKASLPGKRDLYNQYCLIAETTPCYLVVPGFGLIAAAIVAGIFGDKAKRMLDEIQDDEREIREKQSKLDDDNTEMSFLETSHNDIKSNMDLLSAAQQAVAAYRGSWGAISGDLDKNIKQIESATPEKPFAFKVTQLGTLRSQWKDLEAKADEFRVTAFITVKSP